MPDYAANPQASRIRLFAEQAYRRHGLSVQGSLRAYLDAPGIARHYHWYRALVEDCGVELGLAMRHVDDLERAAQNAYFSRRAAEYGAVS